MSDYKIMENAMLNDMSALEATLKDRDKQIETLKNKCDLQSKKLNSAYSMLRSIKCRLAKDEGIEDIMDNYSAKHIAFRYNKIDLIFGELEKYNLAVELADDCGNAFNDINIHSVAFCNLLNEIRDNIREEIKTADEEDAMKKTAAEKKKKCKRVKDIVIDLENIIKGVKRFIHKDYTTIEIRDNRDAILSELKEVKSMLWEGCIEPPDYDDVNECGELISVFETFEKEKLWSVVN